MEVINSIFTGTQVEVDGNNYSHCAFSNVVLIYRGGPPPSFNSCKFNETNFAFRGHAGNTVNFLRAMANPNSGLQRIILDTFPELKEHKPSTGEKPTT